LYLNKLSSVYHGEPGIRTLKELARSYIAMTRDLTRVMSRLKAIYRSWGTPCAGQQVYAPRYRAEWLAKISEVGVRRRAELYYQQFDALAALRQQARRELLAEARKHPDVRSKRLPCRVRSGRNSFSGKECRRAGPNLAPRWSMDSTRAGFISVYRERNTSRVPPA